MGKLAVRPLEVANRLPVLLPFQLELPQCRVLPHGTLGWKQWVHKRQQQEHALPRRAAQTNAHSQTTEQSTRQDCATMKTFGHQDQRRGSHAAPRENLPCQRCNQYGLEYRASLQTPSRRPGHLSSGSLSFWPSGHAKDEDCGHFALAWHWTWASPANSELLQPLRVLHSKMPHRPLQRQAL